MRFFQGTEMPDADWWEALWPDPARVLYDCGLAAGTMAAVDLCAGNGWFTLPMAKIARRVTALDIDGKLLNEGRRRLADAGLSNCEFIEADAYALSEKARSVDFVFLANVFHGVPDRAGLSRMIAEILLPGGQFAIVNWQPRSREETTVLGAPRGPRTELRMPPQMVKAAVEPSGLELARFAEIPPYHYAAIFRKPGAAAGQSR